MKIEKIRKRDGRIVKFDPKRIANAIWKAAKAVGGKDRKRAEELAKQVVELLEKRLKPGEVPTVEQVQDLVEKVLVENGHYKTAKAYILYRQKRAEARRACAVLGVKDDLKLPLNTIVILAARYLLRDEDRNIVETTSQLFRRVARAIAEVEKGYGKSDEYVKDLEDKFYEMMTSFKFLPNSPTLMNAGVGKNLTLSACFVIPIEDDMVSIFEALKTMALVQKAGGGCVDGKARIVFENDSELKVLDLESFYERYRVNEFYDPEFNRFGVDVRNHHIWVFSFDPKTKSVRKGKVDFIWKYVLDKGEEKYEIRTDRGTVILTSPWHPFFVLTRDFEIVQKRADELKKGDMLIGSVFKFKFSLNFDYWLLGFLMGNGLCELNEKEDSGAKIRVYEAKSILEKVSEHLTKKFGKRFPIQKEGNMFYVDIELSLIRRYYLSLKKRLFKSKRALVSFLTGLFDAKGYVSFKPSLQLPSKDGKLIETLTYLLNFLGIKANMRRKKGYGHILIESYPSIFQFYELIGKNSLKRDKKKRLEEILSVCKEKSYLPLSFETFKKLLKPYGITFKIKGSQTFATFKEEKISLGRWYKGKRVSRFALLRVLEKVRGKKAKELLNIIKSVEIVKTISRTKEDKVFYDLSVRGYQNYLAGKNGLVFVHNTGFSFSKLRPAGDVVRSTGGVASGPISFMKIFDVATEQIKQGGCVSADSLIRTDRGILPLGNLIDCPPLGSNPTPYFVFDGETFSHAFLSMDNGVSEVYSLKTDIGLELSLTYNHLVAYLDDSGKIKWKEAWKVKPGDWLIAVKGGYCGDTVYLPPLKSSKNANPVRMPRVLNEKLAEILGFYMAEGRISERKIIFSVDRKNKELMEKIEALMSEVFNLKVGKKKLKGDHVDLIFCSRDLCRYFEEMGWKKESPKKAFIPQQILKAERKVVNAFIRGLFEGGGDIPSDGYPRFCSTSEVLIKQLQQLLLALGVTSRVMEEGKSSTYILDVIEEESRKKFVKEIGFLTTEKNGKLRKGSKKRLKKILRPLPLPQKDKRLVELVNSNYYFTKVVDVRRVKAYTIDIETNSGKFVANGLLVHNKRRGANMGILRVDHPDILDFIVCKEREGTLRNFNISVAVTDKFMRAVERDREIDLINPRNKKSVKKLKARVIWNLLATLAWKNGEPGIIFLDTINKHNPTPHIGEIEATNPCGEQPLLPYESCNLGSINLSKFVEDGKIRWEELRETIKLAVRFLDNVIDANSFPHPEIERATKANRKIGLGVMGFADMLIKLGIPYNSKKALRVAEEVMKFINEEARKVSEELGKEKGSFPNFKGSVWEKKGYRYMRNATVTTIAPTGTISEIAGCSQGIEPLFAIAYVRNVKESLGYDLTVINPLFEMMAIEKGFYSEELIKRISRSTSIQHIKEIPEDVRKIFVTALDIEPEWHVRMQAAFQKYTDNAVSKTVNLPHEATPADVEKIFMLAWKLGCKGITIYRFGSRKVQVIKPIEEAPIPGFTRCEVCEL